MVEKAASQGPKAVFSLVKMLRAKLEANPDRVDRILEQFLDDCELPGKEGHQARKELLDRMDGKASQNLNVSLDWPQMGIELLDRTTGLGKDGSTNGADGAERN